MFLLQVLPGRRRISLRSLHEEFLISTARRKRGCSYATVRCETLRNAQEFAA